MRASDAHMRTATYRPFSNSGQARASSALHRLKSLGPVNEAEILLVGRLGSLGQHVSAGSEWPPSTRGAPTLLLKGWAYRERILHDGRRQIFDFLIPGDIVGFSIHPDPLSSAGVVALNDVEIAEASSLRTAALDAGKHPRLAQLLQLSSFVEGARLMDHLVRLGRRSARERMAHLLLELRDRLVDAGLGDAGSFPMPVRQEILADALGLSLVHVNRTLQLLRHEGAIELRSGRVVLPDVRILSRIAHGSGSA